MIAAGRDPLPLQHLQPAWFGKRFIVVPDQAAVRLPQSQVMVAFDNNPGEKVLPAVRFHEMLAGVSGGVDVLSGQKFDLRTEVRLPAKSALVLALN